MSTFQIGMLIFPGMTALDFAGPLDILARMPGASVHVISKGAAPVMTDIGFEAPATRCFGDTPALDLVFVGGGPGVNALLEDDDTLDFLAGKAEGAAWITSGCTGALVLGAAGLLRGYKAATHWTAMDALIPFGAEPVHERVVVDRNRITGGGVTAGIDFGLTVAKLLHGEPVAQCLQLGMEYDPAPPFQAGSPFKAPAEIVTVVRAGAAALTAERIAHAERIARSWGTVE